MIDGSRVEAGDVVLGLPSAGLHTNGFSLVRGLIGDGDFDADLLLAPHKLYVDEVRELRRRADVKALAHVTGGGILGNLARVLPEGRERRARLGFLGAAARLRVAERAGRERGGAAARLQRRDRDVRGRPGRDAAAGLVIGRVDVIGVLVSGEGTNLQALIDAGLPDRRRSPRTEPERGRSSGPLRPGSRRPSSSSTITTAASSETRPWPTGSSDAASTLVVCAGYMHLLRPAFLERFETDREHALGAAP